MSHITPHEITRKILTDGDGPDWAAGEIYRLRSQLKMVMEERDRLKSAISKAKDYFESSENPFYSGMKILNEANNQQGGESEANQARIAARG